MSSLFDKDTRFTKLSKEDEAKENEHVITQAHFSCENCGSDLVYSPASQDLVCRSCGHHFSVNTLATPIQEYDFKEAVEKLDQLRHLQQKSSAEDNNNSPQNKQIPVIQCPSCGAEFSFKVHEHAGDCPYCETPIITDTAQVRFIIPRSLLPFKFEKRQALDIYDKWIGSRWFAPSSLKDHSKRNDKLVGIFLPYWTYDSQTYNYYRGQRGTTYYVRQSYTTTVNGKRVQRTRMVPKIRWHAVSGQVNLHFDDVLIGATKTLPRTIIDQLQPWDLENLVPYSEEYISGFRSRIYQITVDQGFLQAENIMDKKIRQRVRLDIGGDHQRISNVNTQHENISFKHILLPVWSAAYVYHGKIYRYVINGRNGTIQGERPYSVIKIVAAVITGLAIIGAVLVAMESQGQFR